MPPWQYALAVLMAVAIFAACLFPLAPAWLRSVVVYFFLGLLCSIFVLILLRFLIFMAIFTFTGAAAAMLRWHCCTHVHNVQALLLSSGSHNCCMFTQ
jgi:Translocation protein Sec62